MAAIKNQVRKPRKNKQDESNKTTILMPNALHFLLEKAAKKDKMYKRQIILQALDAYFLESFEIQHIGETWAF